MLSVANNLDYIEFLIRISTAMACGFFIGFERQWINRVAGIQTNVLIATGACVFILSSYFVGYEGQSASRLGAQVVSGIGFLGAGMIFRDGFNTHGINTAATAWCSGAIGVACGMGALPQALMVVAFIVSANLIFRRIDHAISKNRRWNDTRIFNQYEIQAIVPQLLSSSLQDSILKIISTKSNQVTSVKTSMYDSKEGEGKEKITIGFRHFDHEAIDLISLAKEIRNLDGKISVNWSILK